MKTLRRIAGFDAKGMTSIGLWLTRRRDGVPPGAVAFSYAREQSTMTMVLVAVMVVEAVAVELLLQAMGVTAWIRVPVLVLDLYGVVFVLGMAAACVTRPHVVTGQELRIRHGAFFDLRIPRALVSSVRVTRSYNETGTVTVRDGRLAVAVSSQTNVVVHLSEPVTAVRPLGAEAEVSVVRFFADDPAAAVAALRLAEEREAA